MPAEQRRWAKLRLLLHNASMRQDNVLALAHNVPPVHEVLQSNLALLIPGAQVLHM